MLPDDHQLMPERRDFAVSLGALAVVGPVFLWYSWRGFWFPLLIASFYPLVYWLPSAILAFAVLAMIASRPTAVARKYVLQFVIVLAALVPLNMAGLAVSRASRDVSMRRGDRIIDEIVDFKRTRGRYPKGLAELEESIGHALPRPSVDSEYDYRFGEDGFSLGFQLYHAYAQRYSGSDVWWIAD